MSENTGSRVSPFASPYNYKPPHLSRQERKRLAKEKGMPFVPQAVPPTDMVAQQIVGCRQRITAAELEQMVKMDGADMMPVTESNSGK